MKHTLILIGTSLSFIGLLLLSKPAGSETLHGLQDRKMVTLNAVVTVNRSTVVLGDLFQGINVKADTAVAYAPAPGKRAIFDARWLVRLAKAHQINWQPMSVDAHVVVVRKSTVIGRDEIEDRLSQALREDETGYAAGGAELRVQISNRMLQFHMPSDTIGGIGIDDLNYDSVSGRFAAIIRIPENDPSAQRHRVTGRVLKMIRVPVLNERLLAGETIREDNLKEILLPARKVQRNVVIDVDTLIGLTPKRGLAAGIPIRRADIQAPVMVSRGGLVTMNLNYSNMTLTSQGRALENGSKGDVVRVVNTRSNKTIQAIVIGDGLVTVRTGNPELAQNTTIR